MGHSFLSRGRGGRWSSARWGAAVRRLLDADLRGLGCSSRAEPALLVQAICQFAWVGRGRDRPGLVSEGGARFPRDPRVARQVAATAQKAGPEGGGLAAVGLVAGWRPTSTRL